MGHGRKFSRVIVQFFVATALSCAALAFLAAPTFSSDALTGTTRSFGRIVTVMRTFDPNTVAPGSFND